MKKCRVFGNVFTILLQMKSDNEMFKQFILSGFNFRSVLYYFRKNYFFNLHMRKLYKKIQDGVFYKMCFGFYPSCHQWHEGGGRWVTKKYAGSDILEAVLSLQNHLIKSAGSPKKAFCQENKVLCNKRVPPVVLNVIRC